MSQDIASRLEKLERIGAANWTPEQANAYAVLSAEASKAPPAPEATVERDPETGVPDGYFLNPETGQMTSRELIKGNYEPNRYDTVVGSAMQGAGFQFGDEAMGLMGAVEGAMRPDMSAGEMGRFRREQARAMLEANQEEYPGLALSSEIIGSLPAAVATGSLLGSARTLPQAMGQGAKLGFAEGTLYGAGRGEGFEGRAKAATRDSIMGAGVGGAAPLAFNLAKRGVELVADPAVGLYDAAVGRPSEGRANRALLRTLQRSGKEVADLDTALDAARAAGQPEYRVMDALGGAGQARASAVARRSDSEAAQEIADFLANRQLDQPARVRGFVDDAFDLNGQTASQLADAASDTRGAVAYANYRAARDGAGAVNLNNALAVIDDALGSDFMLNETSSLKQSALGSKLQSLRNMMQSDGEQLIDFDRVLDVKQAVGDVMDRYPKGKIPPRLMQLKTALDEALGASSDGYRAANDTFAAQSRVVDAYGEGERLAKSSRLRAEDTVADYRALPAAVDPDLGTSARQAGRQGYGDRIIATIEDNKAPFANRAREFSSPRRRTEAMAIASNPDQFLERMARENEMHRTLTEATGGSHTATKLAEMADLESETAGILDLAGGGPMTGTSLVQRAGRALAPYAQGMNEDTVKIIARALMSGNASTAFSPALAGQAQSAARQQIIDAILRAAMRPEQMPGALVPEG